MKKKIRSKWLAVVYSVTRKKSPNVYKSCTKMIDFETFTKNAKECGRFGQINCCQRLLKVAQSPIIRPIRSHYLVQKTISLQTNLGRALASWDWYDNINRQISIKSRSKVEEKIFLAPKRKPKLLRRWRLSVQTMLSFFREKLAGDI